MKNVTFIIDGVGGYNVRSFRSLGEMPLIDTNHNNVVKHEPACTGATVYEFKMYDGTTVCATIDYCELDDEEGVSTMHCSTYQGPITTAQRESDMSEDM